MSARNGKYSISDRIASLQGQGFVGNEAEQSRQWVIPRSAPKAEDHQLQQVKGKQLRAGWEAQRLDTEMERLKRELAEMQRLKSGGKEETLTNNAVHLVPNSKSTSSPSSLSSSEKAPETEEVEESKEEEEEAVGGDEKEGVKEKDEKPVADTPAKEQTREDEGTASQKPETNRAGTSNVLSGEKQQVDTPKATQKKRFKWNVRIGLASLRNRTSKAA